MSLISCGSPSLANRVLITGGTGFVGRSLIEKLRGEGFDPIALGSSDGDIATLDLEKFKHERIERVVHLAGRTFVPESWQNPLEFYRTNIMGTVNVAEFCRQVGASLTYISAYVYGNPSILPLKEDDPVNPNNPYAYTKLLGEKVCLQYADLFALPVTILRPFNIYGMGQSNSFLIPKIIHQVLHEELIELENLNPCRDYIYISDLVEAVTLSFRDQNKCATYNLGSGMSISVAEVVDIIQKVAGTNKPVISKNIVRDNEILDVVADMSKFTEMFNWQPKFDFASGIEDIFSFRRKNDL